MLLRSRRDGVQQGKARNQCPVLLLVPPNSDHSGSDVFHGALDCKRSKRACSEPSDVFGEMPDAVAMRTVKN